MQLYVPEYYPLFSCKAGACRHSCCIGWEIDIDRETLAYYRTVSGELGVRLREVIEDDGENAYFRLGEKERCPFLNSENLCDLFIQLGEEHLCQICTDHPRYRNILAGRCEMGLGLACEAAGELILTYPKKVAWHFLSEDDESVETTEWEELLLQKRQRVIDILQNRSKTVLVRTQELFDDVWFGKSPEEWQDIFMELERMEPTWEERLALLTSDNVHWQDENDLLWEQLLVYFVHRHLAGAWDETECETRLGFAVLSYAVLRTMYEGVRRDKGEVTLPEIVELARLYSAEIEYSEENTAALLEKIEAAIYG